MNILYCYKANVISNSSGLAVARRAALAALLAVPWLPLPGRAQDDFLVVKGQVLAQTSAAAPLAVTSAGAVLDVETPSYGGTAIVSGGKVTLPGGSTQTLSLSPDGTLFQFTDIRDTVGALDTTYPAGHYVVSLTSTLLSGLTAGIDVPADSFPTAPQVSNFSAIQAVDASKDFHLMFQPFAGAQTPDDAVLELYDGANLLVSYSLGLSDSSVLVPANTLSRAKTYQGRLRFRHIQADATAFPPSGFGFFSETRFPLVTSGSSGGTGTPPTLVTFLPANGSVLPGALSGLILQFSAAMDTNRVVIQWTATLNGTAYTLAPSTFMYAWSDPQTLACLYAPQMGGWPAGLVVNWTLSPTAGNASNFADSSGNLLAVNTYSGTFLTSGGPWNCQAQLAQPLEAPAFSVSKSLNYRQTSAGAPASDSTAAAQFYAYYRDPYQLGSTNLTPIVALTVPILNNPTNWLLKVLTITNLATQPYRYYWDSQPTGAALDGSYPQGSYTLQLGTPNPTNRNLPFIVTDSVTLELTSSIYPPVPQFTNFAAVQSIAVSNDFTLGWAPFAGADTNTAFIQLRIADASNNVVFVAPNSCAGLSLPPTATSITLPANTLQAGRSYTVALAFGRLVSPPTSLRSVPGQGFSALQSVTRLSLVINNHGSGQLPPVVSISSPVSGATLPAGPISFQVAASDLGAPLASLQLYSGSSLLTSKSIPPGQNDFTGQIAGNFPPGPQMATVVVVDANGLSAAAGPVSFIAQDPAFVVNLTNPANGAQFPPLDSILLSASASSPSGTITNVDFFMDGALLGSAASAPFAIGTPQLLPGSHTFYARAEDGAGFSGLSPAVMIFVAAPGTNRLAAALSASGQFSLAFAGSLGADYVLEATTNLSPPVLWSPLQHRRLTSSTAVFSDPAFGQGSQRFYRAVPFNSSMTNLPAFSVSGSQNPLMAGADLCDLEGASVALTNLDGTVYTLDLPAGAIDLAQTVSITLVTNLDGYPLNGSLVTAVELAPSEYYLFTPGTLTIQLPASISATQVVAFSYHVPNGEFFLEPFTLTNTVTSAGTNSAVVIPVGRLGGYGLAMLNVRDLGFVTQFQPTAPADQWDQITAVAVLQLAGVPVQTLARVKTRGGAGSLMSPGDHQALVQAFLDQWDNVIYPQMQAAVASNTFPPTDQYSGWLKFINDLKAAGLEHEFSLQLADFITAYDNIIQVNITKRILRANQQHDWEDLIIISSLDLAGNLNYTIGGASGWKPGQKEALQQAIDQCLTFELDVDSLMVTSTDIGEVRSHLQAKVTVKQGNPNLTGKVKGQAPSTWQETTYPPVSQCGAAFATPTTPNFQVDLFNPTGSKSGGPGHYRVTGLIMVLNPNMPREQFQVDCPDQRVNLGDFWWPDFGYLYQANLSAFPKRSSGGITPSIAFRIADGWQMGGGGGNAVLATRTENGTGELKGGTVKETTTFTFKHTPQ